MKKKDFILMHISNYSIIAVNTFIENKTTVKAVPHFLINDAIVHANLLWEKIPDELKEDN